MSGGFLHKSSIHKPICMQMLGLYLESIEDLFGSLFLGMVAGRREFWVDPYNPSDDIPSNIDEYEEEDYEDEDREDYTDIRNM